MSFISVAATASPLLLPAERSIVMPVYRPLLQPARRWPRPRSRSIRLDESLSDDAVRDKLARLRNRKPVARPSAASVSPEAVASPANEKEKEFSFMAPPPGLECNDDDECVLPELADGDEDKSANDEEGPAPIDRLRATVAARATAAAPLDESAAAEIRTFLNEYLGDEMLGWVLIHTELGKEAARKNAWSARSWVPKTARIEALTGRSLTVRVGVQERGKAEPTILITELALPRPVESVDALRDVLLELSQPPESEGGKGGSAAMSPGTSAILLQLPGATDDWSLPDDLWLNTCPYPRAVRQMFYEDVSSAMQAAVADFSCARRMRVWVSPPELNMEMDSYRVGSLLELVRDCALGFAKHGLRTRVCVQGSMGQGAFTGVPRVLSGIRKLLSMMDWQAQPGEEYEGLLTGGDGEGDGSDGSDGSGAGVGGAGGGEEGAFDGMVRFGAVGAAEVSPSDDVLLVLAPQSMVGASIYEPLRAMTEAAEAQGSAIILINPQLQDRQSSSGVMGVRGRAERLAFASSFEDIYTFRNIYSGTTFMYPILGGLRLTRPVGAVSGGRRVLYQRRESGGHERYEPVGCWLRREPSASEITELVPNQVVGVGPAGGGAQPAPSSAPAQPASAIVKGERMPWD